MPCEIVPLQDATIIQSEHSYNVRSTIIDCVIVPHDTLLGRFLLRRLAGCAMMVGNRLRGRLMRVGWGLVVAIACSGLSYTTPLSLAQDSTVVLGPKPNSCGTWVKARSAGGKNTEAYESWVLGFLSGATIFGKTNTDFLNAVDADAIFVWIDNYCKANPLENLSKSVIALTHELNNRALQKR